MMNEGKGLLTRRNKPEDELRRKAAEDFDVGGAGTATPGDAQELLNTKLDGMFPLIKELVRQGQTTRRFLFGRLLGVIATAVQFPSFRCDFGVIIKAEGGNAAMIYIGDAGATAAAGLRVGGFELDANQAMIIPCRELSDLYMYDTPGGQYASYFAM